uniref:Uncharacterized protein n=1 Tax=Panagrolaimus sp. PS1159 TaxID=55785 RepID=A0AC35FI16_9BILA
MSVLEGAIGIGSVIGFFCTSFIKSTSYLNAYFLMTGIHILCIIFVLSLNDIKPTKEILEEKKKGFLNRLGNKLTSWRSLFKIKETRKKLFILIFSFGLSFFSFIGTIHILFYYLKQRFHWDLKLYAYLKAPDQMLSTLAILFLFPFFKSKGISDPALALLGLLSRCFGRLWLALSWNTESVYFLIILDSLSRFSPTAIRSMFSKTVAENEQGRIFSLISVVELSCTLLASIVFHTLFPYSISFFPQLSFVLMGSILIPPILLIV